MNEREIDLSRAGGDFIDVPRGPLDRPKALYWGMVVFGVGAVVGALAANLIGTWWSAFLPIPMATLFGVALAGRFPASFFRRDHT